MNTRLAELHQSGATTGQVPVWNATTGLWEPGTAASSLTVQDENGNVGAGVTQIDFQGAGVTATAGTSEIVVTVPAIPTKASGLTTAWVPLQTTVGGVPELVWDANNELVLVEVPVP